MGEPSYSIESEQPLTLCLKIPSGSLKKNKDPSIWRTALTWTLETWAGSRVETTRLPRRRRIADARVAPPMVERRAFARRESGREHAPAHDPAEARPIESSRRRPPLPTRSRRWRRRRRRTSRRSCRREHGHANAPCLKTPPPRRRQIGVRAAWSERSGDVMTTIEPTTIPSPTLAESKGWKLSIERFSADGSDDGEAKTRWCSR